MHARQNRTATIYTVETAFTLVELLVVIAVIAILAAVLFPVLVSARARGHEARCLSNLRQINTAINLYLDDNCDRYPGYRAWKGKAWLALGEIDAPGNPPRTIPGLIGILQPYVKNNDIWMCPAGAKRPYRASECSYPPGRTAAMVGWVRLPSGNLVSTNYISFPLNPDHDHPNHPPNEIDCALYKTPEECQRRWGRLFHEGGPFASYETPAWSGRFIQDAYTKTAPAPWQPHGHSTNILYFDGHAAAVHDPRWTY
ncbi:MAG: type II secretion system protein [Armatimonadota bacterium]|nr:type II secretion system protein [Armatimonadota bacterium]